MHVFLCTYTSTGMHHTTDHTFFTEQSGFHQLVLLVYKCYHVCLSKPSEGILIRSIPLILYFQNPAGNIYAPSITKWLICTYSNTILLLLIMSAFNSTDEHVYLIIFLNYELSGGRWRNLEDELHRKNTLNEYSDYTHYEARRCTCKENSTSCSLLITIFLLVH